MYIQEKYNETKLYDKEGLNAINFANYLHNEYEATDKRNTWIDILDHLEDNPKTFTTVELYEKYLKDTLSY